MSVMWAHPYIGYEFVGRISFLSEAAEIVLTHHERFDGSGYPQRLWVTISRWEPGSLPSPIRWMP